MERLPPSATTPFPFSNSPQVNEKRGAAGLGEVRQAFEYTLDRLGQDVGSGAIWQDYVAFLQVGMLSVLFGSWER